ncbi:MAG: glutathione S-transferase family protein, partial [Pseudomonadota bacterium]
EIKSMQGLHVYHYFLSNCAQRVNLTLAEKGLDWTPHSVSLLTKQNTKDEYLSINPSGLVPAMVRNGVVITESIDILRYIEAQFPTPPLYPEGSSRRQQVGQWMDGATENHNAVVKTYMYAMTFGGAKSPEEMERYLAQQEDPGLKAFHQQATAGFSQDQISAAERAVCLI